MTKHQVKIRLSDEELDYIKKAARMDGRSVSNWCAAMLNKASHGEVLQPKQPTGAKK